MVNRKGVAGWMMYDWASQPFHTLLVTFIFAPYFSSAVAVDDVIGQSQWGYAIGIGGLLIALMSPVLGAMADQSGPRKPWIFGFSVLYVVGTLMLWQAVPLAPNPWMILSWFVIALVGVELTTSFTNAMLPDLGSRAEIGRISGTGWALGYVGGLVSLVLMLGLMIADGATGQTLLGLDPVFGLDPGQREGDRASGPLSAIWYVVFIIPLFLWTPDLGRRTDARASVPQALRELWATLRQLPQRPSFFAYLGSSMIYRDALNGLYAFGGIYAAGVLGWSIIQIGIFGIVAAAAGALGAWLGGKADSKYGPGPIITASIWVLIGVTVAIILTSKTSVLGLPVAAGSSLPTILFYICGALIGAAGGSLQSASRTMLVHQAEPEKMTEAFGLFALTGKATAFVAPFAIAVATAATGSQRLGVSPIIVLFLIGLVLLYWVKTDPEA